MTYFWTHFRRERTFLSGYFLAHTLVLLSALLLLHTFGLGFTEILAPIWFVLLVPLAMYWGLRVSTIMHNCMHGNLSWGNRLFGELSAFFVLMSFGIVCTHHQLHHAFPDTEWDPHSPEGLTFWRFFFFSQFRGVKATEDKFLQFHGRTPANVALFKFNILLHFLDNALRVLLWAQLLGPYFLTLYLPAFLTYLFVFAHVNYVTHRRDEKGKSLVVNVDTSFYHHLINWICDGVYFHENHHRFPRRYNPKLTG